MIGGNGSIAIKSTGSKDFAPEFRERFKKYKASSTITVMIDTLAKVEYLMLVPTAYDVSNTTITVATLLDSSGFPYFKEREGDVAFNKRFKSYKVDKKSDVLVDLETGVQYFIAKPTEHEVGNSTISVTPLLSSEGFPFMDDRIKNNE